MLTQETRQIRYSIPLDALAAKRSRTGSNAGLEVNFDLEQLQSFEKEVLVGMALGLQTRLRDTQQKLVDTNSALKESSGIAPKDVAWTPEKVAERAQKVRDICSKEIKKQMKWQPSCKKGSTKWSYTGVVRTKTYSAKSCART